MRRWFALFVLLAAALAQGCGPSGPAKYSISGTVLLDDKPLPEGHIVFMPVDPNDSPAAGPIKDGKYAFESTPGKKRVEISATREEGPADPAMGQVPRKQYLAPRFNIETTLQAEVSATGPHQFDYTVSEK